MFFSLAGNPFSYDYPENIFFKKFSGKTPPKTLIRADNPVHSGQLFGMPANMEYGYYSR